MRLDLNLLEVFCCVYEEGGFSRAARKLLISQPTVSGHIKHLEEYLGVKLFDRLPRRIVPTRAGQLLYRRGHTILKEKEAALPELKKFLHRTEGSLTVCGSGIPGEYLLPQIIASFYARFPAVKIEVRISDSEEVCLNVLDGKAELGFTCTKIKANKLEFRQFASSELVLVVPHNREWRHVESITRDRLAMEPFLAREVGSGVRLTVEKKLGRTLDEFNVVGSFSSNSAIKEAVKAGLGMSVLPLLAVTSEVANGTLKTVAIEGISPLRCDFFVVINKTLTRSPIAKTFLQHALKNPA